MDAMTRDRTTRMFQFLQEFTQLKYKPQRTSDADSVLWLHSLPQEPEIQNAARLTEREVPPDEWLVIRKPKFRPAPSVPDALTEWVNGSANQVEKPPTVRTQRVVTTEVLDDDLQPQQIQETLFLDDDKPLLAAWERYEREWQVWAAEERRARAVQDRYSQLFDFHQRLESFGETYELRLGFGYLAWRTPGGAEVRRHLLTARAALTFDALRGVLTVTASGDGARTSLEQDMLDADERPLPQVQDHIRKALEDSGEEVWSGAVLPDLLKAWVNAAGERGVYAPDLIPPRGAPTDPTVHWAPALVLRRRGERSLAAAFGDIVKQVGQLGALPETLRRFVEVSDAMPERGGDGEPSGQRAAEVYFPLPANDAQMEIIRKLSRQPGVLVQGPPGTGKSHTIVNLVSHLLATNQRVLVTSHTARALKVLRDKFPPELAALCVTHLRGEEGSKAMLERSVQEITHRANNREPEALETARLHSLSQSLETARQEEDRLLDELRSIRQAEVGELDLHGYQGSAQETGERLRAQEPLFGWLTELGNPADPAPWTDAQATRLLGLLRGFTPAEEAELAQRWPAPEDLVRPEQFLGFVRDEAEAANVTQRHAGAQAHPHFGLLREADPEARGELLDALRTLSGLVYTLRGRPEAWLAGAVDALLRGQAGLWQEVRARTDEALPTLLERGDWLGQVSVSGLGQRDPLSVRADAETVRDHLQGGGGWGNFLRKPAAVKNRQYLREEIKVGGRAADTPPVLQELIDAFDLNGRLGRLEELWRGVGAPVSGPVKLRLVALREQQEALKGLDAVMDRIARARTATRKVPGLPEPRWWDAAELDSLMAALQAASAEAAAAASRRVLNDLLPALESLSLLPGAHPVLAELQQAIQARDADTYGQAYLRVVQLSARRELLRECEQLLEKLCVSAPVLADELRGNPEAAEWDERLASFEAAWRWMRADAELARISNPDTEVEVRQQLAACRQRIRDTLRDLATHRAWTNTLNRLTQREQQGLERWKRAMKSLGKGNGKHAERHRQAARAALEDARSAIPAWIMPLHLVGETFSMKPGMFDVVIVDEASQAGPESLFLTFIAKKVIIVGDDKQIEPEGVGLQTDRVDALVKQFLSDLPAPEILGERKASLFGFGAYTYADRISLREHFRCMPEIIKFSSDLSYEDQPLIALRQFGASRLEPLMIRHIPEGFRYGKSNPAEARAIVDQIKKCIQDPRYRDAEGRPKTIGVISLVGDEQAEEIASLLRAEVPERELEERKVVCGDAYSFQGDERDVMFLSMVDSPTDGKRAAKRSRDDAIFQPRYNVAASRARDQLWLFHSVDLPDLHPDDLRASLIGHMRNPELAQFQPLQAARIRDLRTEAARPGRARNNAPRPFDSWFELDVYLRLVERGYSVIPQYEMNGYRIDLVVEGLRGRLAVECDGDRWHGAEQFRADLHRQQVLERAGMQFWRVRGSTYTRDPEAALEDLWRTLDERGVYPEGDPRNFAPQAEPEGVAGHATIPGADMEGLPAKQTADMNGSDNKVTLEEPLSLVSLPDVMLAPYTQAVLDILPDPRDLPTLEPVVEGLRQIIEAEGPMLCRVAYRSYARAAGLAYGKTLQSQLNKAAALGVRLGVFEQNDENGLPGQVEKVVRVRGAAPVRLRERGPRELTDIPPLELAALMRELQQTEPELAEERHREDLFRRVLVTHGGERLTLKRREVLELSHRHLLQGQEVTLLLS
ncbi:AAA domain-containing protein [Deinococcus sp. NW-56]|uniref:AAA domain-containing protein n=1 Tax=Deinococcus sp. NW-56 TaxID=2080419 RepID=UPI000CF52EE7|nr:AAA domain-containing protein [Deinococcus sp. NW-56]